MLLIKIGDLLIHERHRRHRSYQSVSKETGIRITRLYELEAGLKNPSDEELQQFAVMYERDIHELKKLRDEGGYRNE